MALRTVALSIEAVGPRSYAGGIGLTTSGPNIQVCSKCQPGGYAMQDGECQYFPYYTVEEVALRFRVSSKTVGRWLREIPVSPQIHARTGRRLLTDDDLDVLTDWRDRTRKAA